MKGEVLAKSLKEYKLEASESKIIRNSSEIGESKITKFPIRVQPHLVRWSTHLFASEKRG